VAGSPACFPNAYLARCLHVRTKSRRSTVAISAFLGFILTGLTIYTVAVPLFNAVYETAYEELVATLRQEYPTFWDNEAEEFTDPVSANAIEGGNWRLKYGLGVPYARYRGARARTSLLALRDSMSTFANGEPAESFAHHHGSFSFDQVWDNPQHDRYCRERAKKWLRRRRRNRTAKATGSASTSPVYPSPPSHSRSSVYRRTRAKIICGCLCTVCL
jgi:hypothetical protein